MPGCSSRSPRSPAGRAPCAVDAPLSHPLPPSACARSRQRSSFGIGLQAIVRVQLARHGRRQVEAFQQHALARPETLAVFHVTGEDDFLVHVAVRDADHLREMALDAFTSRPEVARIQTSLLFGHTRKPQLPAYPPLEPGRVVR